MKDMWKFYSGIGVVTITLFWAMFRNGIFNLIIGILLLFFGFQLIDEGKK